MRLFLLVWLGVSIANTEAPKKKSKSKPLVYDLNDQNFEPITESFKGNTNDWLVLFMQPWCEKSNELVPMWQNLAAEMKGSHHFAQIEISSNPITAERFDIKGYPTIILLHEGSFYNFSGKATPKKIKRFANTVWRGDDQGIRIFPTHSFVFLWSQIIAELKMLVTRKMWVCCIIFFSGAVLGGMVTVMLITLCTSEYDPPPVHRYRGGPGRNHDIGPINPTPLGVRVAGENEDSDDEHTKED